MRLNNILFLTENRAEFILKKQGDKLSAVENIDANEVLIKLQEADPSRNKQYLQWLVNQYLKKQFRLEDAPRVRSELEQFESIKNRIEQKDINTYDYYKLGELLQSIFGKDTELDIDTSDPNLNVLYSGPLGLLVVPKTKTASCRAGSGTKWCTAARENNMFDDYNQRGPLYIWKDKSGEKYQIHFETGQYMNAQDRPVGDELLRNWYKSHPVLSKLFKMYENELLRMGHASNLYNWAKQIIGGRWPEAERYFVTDPQTANRYAIYVIGGRWPEAEPYIMKDPKSAYWYAKNIIKGRWPEAEPHIMKSPNHVYWYAHNVIGGRWPEAEPYIMKSPNHAYLYADEVIKGRWPEAEPSIRSNKSRWNDYKNRFKISE